LFRLRKSQKKTTLKKKHNHLNIKLLDISNKKKTRPAYREIHGKIKTETQTIIHKMEYHQHQPVAPHHHHMNHYGSHFPPQSSLPDASGNEKTIMWSGSSYMSPPESGYSTQAPSISSIDAFLNNEQTDNTSVTGMSNFNDAASTISADASNTVVNQPPPPQQQAPLAPPTQSAQYTQLQPPQGSPPQEQQQQQQPTTELMQPADNENPIADWINYQDNSEMAIKAIPDLLKLLVDEDLVIVQQAAILLNQMSRMEVPRMGLIQSAHAVQCLVDCLNTTADLETARNLVGALYGVSAQKPLGVQAIVNSKALPPLIKILW
jgi:hypothetical protein